MSAYLKRVFKLSSCGFRALLGYVQCGTLGIDWGMVWQDSSLSRRTWDMVWKDAVWCYLISTRSKTNLSDFCFYSPAKNIKLQSYLKWGCVYFFSSLSCRVLMYSIASSITWEKSKVIGVIILKRSEENKITINVKMCLTENTSPPTVWGRPQAANPRGEEIGASPPRRRSASPRPCPPAPPGWAPASAPPSSASRRPPSPPSCWSCSTPCKTPAFSLPASSLCSQLKRTQKKPKTVYQDLSQEFVSWDSQDLRWQLAWVCWVCWVCWMCWVCWVCGCVGSVWCVAACASSVGRRLVGAVASSDSDRRAGGHSLYCLQIGLRSLSNYLKDNCCFCHSRVEMHHSLLFSANWIEQLSN